MYDPEILSAYLSSEMAWWNGAREAKGVEMEEAFKCNMCEFAPSCGWRAEMKAKAEDRHGHGQSTIAATYVQAEPDPNPGDHVQVESVSGEKAKAKIPGEWISETGSETVMQQQDGIEVGGGRKGQERSRSVI